jgi:hypothetical protein
MSDLAKERIPRIRVRNQLSPLGKDHAAALGQVVAAWSLVESYCSLIISYALDIDLVRHAVLSEINFLQRVSIISALVGETRDQELSDHWDDMLTIIDRLRTERNDMVHGDWRATPITDMVTQHIVMRITAKRQVTATLQAVSLDYLIDLEKRIIELVDQLAWFITKLSERGFKKVFSDARTKPPLDPTQSHKARAQAQARKAKLDRKELDRQNPKNRAPKEV